MSRWTGPLKVEQDISGGKQRVTLLDDLVWEIGYEGSDNFLIVEAGTRSDGLSIPVWLEWLADRVGRGLRAALHHDDLRGKITDGQPDPRYPTTKATDLLFREQLKASGFSWFRRWALYLGVRLAVWFPWLADLGVEDPKG